MSKSYPEITQRIASNLKALRSDISDTMQGFSAMAQAATKDGVLDKKTKELIAIAASLGFNCEGCLEGHLKKALEFGATRQEISEAICIAMGVAAAGVVDQTDIVAEKLQLDHFE